MKSNKFPNLERLMNRYISANEQIYILFINSDSMAVFKLIANDGKADRLQ